MSSVTPPPPGNSLTGLVVEFAMHFVHDCYSKLSGVRTYVPTYVAAIFTIFSVAMCICDWKT